MRQIRIKQVDVFTQIPSEGTPVAVVLEADELSTDKMLKIAKEARTLTAFLLTPSKSEAEYKVRFFTPKKEIMLAESLTIAIIQTLAEEARLFLSEPKTTVTQETNNGLLAVEIYIENGLIKKIMVPTTKPTFMRTDLELSPLIDIFGIAKEAANLPLEIVTTSSPHLIVPVESLNILNNLSPNFLKLKELSKEIGVVSVVAFALESTLPVAFATMRNFAPILGVLEDADVGGASSALAAYLVKNGVLRGNSPITAVFEQGHNLERPAEITTEVHFKEDKIEKIKTGGKAVTVLTGEISL